MSTAIVIDEHVSTADIVASNVRAHAGRLQINQVALGRELGMSQGAITKRWKGLRPWQLHELDALSELFDVSVQELVTDHSIEMQNPRRWIAPRGAAARSKGLEPPPF